MKLPTGADRPEPPRAEKHPVSSVMFGDERIDDYQWLREKGTAPVTANLEAENAYAAAAMKPTEKLQEQLYGEMLGRIQQTDVTVPVKQGHYLYYSRTEEGKQYPIHCRRRGSMESKEEVIVDMNEEAKGHGFFAIDAMEVSDDERYLAYTIDTTGFREFGLVVKDLETGAVTGGQNKVSSIAWAKGKTLFYAVDDPAKRAYRVYRHSIDREPAKDDLVYEEKDERFNVMVERTRSKGYVLIESASHTATEFRYVPAGKPESKPALIEPRSDNHEYYVEHRGTTFYILTNDQGRNFRVATAPVKSPGKRSWKTLVPHSDTRMLESLDVFDTHYVLAERENGLPHLRIAMLAGKSEPFLIGMPEPAYEVSPGDNPEFSTASFRYTYTSLTTPLSTFDYDIANKTSTLLKETPVLGGFDRTQYQTERVFAKAADGVEIPFSVVYKKTTPRDGSARLLLEGYGAYGFSYPISFWAPPLSLVDRGFILAIAHIRGGGEMGKKWHDDGRMLNKMHTFTDFIAVAEHLIAKGYTSSNRLAIEGGSAGGLLIGAVVNLRPELFGAAIAQVPFVDVLNTMLDSSLPLTVGEFEEWGNPQIEDQYRAMRAYCPYTNVAARDYPTMLVKTSLNDSQVMYWEPAKWVAKLRAHKTDHNLLLLQTNMDGGHGGASGRYDKLRESAFDYAFLLTQLPRP